MRLTLSRFLGERLVSAPSQVLAGLLAETMSRSEPIWAHLNYESGDFRSE